LIIPSTVFMLSDMVKSMAFSSTVFARYAYPHSVTKPVDVVIDR
jgi:hypothetical protein